MESIKELRKICQPVVSRPPFFSLFNYWVYRFYRFFSIYLTWIFLHFKKITANQITIGGSALFILAPFCYLKGEYWLNLIGIFLVSLANILDYVDGEMARYRGQTTPISGNFLEPLTHDIKYAFLFIPLALGASASFIYPTLLIFLGFAASISKVLTRFAKLRYIHIVLPLQSEVSYRKIGEKAFYSDKKLKTIIGYFGGTSGILFWLLLATILDKVYLFVIFYGILFSLTYLALLIKQYRGIKSIKI